MIKEIYCKMPSDINYYNNKLSFDDTGKIIECQTIAENLLQRIRVCLGTRPGDVLGDPNFGIDLEEYIFDMGVDIDEIETQIREFLYTYAMMGYNNLFNLNVEIHFGKDVTSPTAPYDYYIIDIYLNDQKTMGVVVTT